MFGFGRPIEVVPISFHEGFLRFRSAKKLSPGKSVKLKIILMNQDAPTVSVKITEVEEEDGLYTCLALVKEKERKIQEITYQMALVGVEGACRRGTKRLPATIRIRSRQLPNYGGVTTNVNQTGVEVQTDALLTVGTPVSLDLDVPELDDLFIQATTIWSVEVPAGTGKSTFRAGLAFAERDPIVLEAWSAFYRRLLQSEGASVMLKTMGDGSDSSLRESQRVAAMKEAGRAPGGINDSGLHQTVPESRSGDSGRQSVPPPPPPPPPAPVSKPPSFPTAPPQPPMSGGAPPFSQPGHGMSNPTSQFPPQSPTPGFAPPTPPSFGAPQSQPPSFAPPSQSHQTPSFPSPSQPQQFSSSSPSFPGAPPFGAPQSNSPFPQPARPTFSAGPPPPPKPQSSGIPKRLSLDSPMPSQPSPTPPPAQPAGPPSFSSPGQPPSPPAFNPPGNTGAPSLSFNPPGNSAPPSFPPAQANPPSLPFGTPGTSPTFNPPTGSPPSFQAPTPPSLNLPSSGPPSFQPPPAPSFQPPAFGQQPGPGGFSGFPPPQPPERVTPLRIAGENIMFSCTHGERYSDGASVKVELAFQIQGQMKTVTVTVSISGKQRNADGSYTCIGVVREDQQRIQILNQLLG